MSSESEGVYRDLWYLYGEGKYEGPFTSKDILKLIRITKVKSNFSVWNEALETWQPIESIDFFREALADMGMSSSSSIEAGDLPQSPPPNLNLEKKIFMSEEFSFLNEGGSVADLQSSLRLPSLKRRNQMILRGLVAGIIASGTIVFFMSPHVPGHDLKIKNVQHEDELLLKAAIREPLESGAFATIAMSEGSTGDPSFVIGSNLPDETRLKLTLDGLAETLVGAYRVSAQSEIFLKKGLSYSQAVRLNDGQPLPMGEYQVAIFRDGETKPIGQKIFFIGGARDSDYDLKLRSYHELVRKQARAELSDFHQLADAWEGQLQETSDQFQKSVEKSDFSHWDQFDDKWQQMHRQLANLVEKMNADNKQGKVFYGSLLSLIQETQKTVESLHATENDYRQKYGKAMPGDWRNKVASDFSLAQSNLLNVRAKIKLVEELPLSANGMPRSE